MGEIPYKKPQNKYSQQKPTCKPKNLTLASTVRRTGSPDWSEPDWSHLHYQLVRQVQSPLALKPLKMLCDRIQIQCLCGFHTVECKRYIVMHVNIDTSFLFSVVASPLSKAHTTQHLELISVTSSAHCQYLSFIITFLVCSIHKMLQHNFPFHINLLQFIIYQYFLLHFCATPFTCFHYHIWI